MFKSKTVIVVGAGASAEVGLPIGNQLKSTIADKLDIKFPDGYKQVGGDYEIMEAYRLQARLKGLCDPNRFRAAGVKMGASLPLAISIDNYLEAHAGNEEVELCGKLAIVQSILEAERGSYLFTTRSEPTIDMSEHRLQNTWYVALMRLLTEGLAKVDVEQFLSNVCFVIFNYDRCVETFLRDAISLYYDIPQSKAEEILNSAEFIHPYGTVGRLPWQNGSGQAAGFGAQVSASNLLALASGVRTFSEQIESQTVIDSIRARVASTETMVFLGFAFHRQNMELLATPEKSIASNVFGSALGISGSDKAVVVDLIKASLGAGDDLLNIFLPSATCAELLSEFSRSITQ